MDSAGRNDSGARLKRRWRYTVETVTPLHIGAGGEPLREGVNYRISGRDVQVLDAERAFERIYERAQTQKAAPKKPARKAAEQEPVSGLAAQLLKLGFQAEKEEVKEEQPQVEEVETDRVASILGRLASGMTARQAEEANLLVKEDFDKPGSAESLVNYVLRPRPGVDSPLPKLEPPQILHMVKDARLGRYPYIPGSSIKGALRTVLAERMFAEREQPVTTRDVLDNRGRADARWADDNLEREMFGPDQNRDMMRAILVGDSEPLNGPPALEVTGTYSINYQGRLQFKQGYFVALETLAPGVKLSGDMSLDLHLFKPEVSKQLGFSKDDVWLGEIVRHCNEHAQILIEEETEFYRQYGPPQLVTFYNNLRRRLGTLAEGECLLQMSWGTGWMAKTLGPSLAEQEAFPQIREMFRQTMKRRDTEVFPKTRRLVVGGREHREPVEPMGWVVLSLKEVG
ncbi:MAG TPA: type III-A CRISPR-associated RAMP protein Csm5 [Chloroflexia bacterium]|nr:type III-A CRISPR-associated RAMP protein Csm5 [Chloroflexia bacterium]